MVGRVLAAWLMSESGNAVVMVMEDHIDNDELQGVSDTSPCSVSGTNSAPFSVFPAEADLEYSGIDPASILRSRVRTAVAVQNPGPATGLIKQLIRSPLTNTLAGLHARMSQAECTHVQESVQRTRNAQPTRRLVRSTKADLTWLPGVGFLGLASNANKAKTATPTDGASGFAAPSSRSFVAHSPAGPVSIPCPAVSAYAARSTSLLSNVGARKRKAEGEEMVETMGIHAGEAKRARVGMRTSDRAWMRGRSQVYLLLHHRPLLCP
ncbi:hypothetical protein RSOLAG1IB_11737 [Rhizoctonia solani AG-1 IB]|uniref:Uncharacterized protein n=1 Tax=Thanatephorus cucumeris (strain AG1-IB / isolate 7/3/14) TaxID=1108050 RepID=A0A0B7FEM1_THACB|nr:hypothetical protein RSOLAG1IB_11737 [Rhizoctonia solani AG-1 IB]